MSENKENDANVLSANVDKPVLVTEPVKERELDFECSYCDTEYFVDECESAFETASDGTVCANCYDDHYFECYNCSNVYNNRYANSYDDYYYCNGCYDEVCDSDDVDNYYRKVDVKTDNNLSKPTNKSIVQSSRIFSAEIEAYYPNVDAVADVHGNMPDDLGTSYDGSLNDKGIEYQTPRLSGIKGENYITKLCDLLVKNKYEVNSTCGLHIHLDGGKDFLVSPSVNPKRLKALIMFYLNYEDVILSFLPYSRRNNRYCCPLSYNYQTEDVVKVKKMTTFEQMWYKERDQRYVMRKKANRYEDTRYSGINFHTLLSDNHIEIRFHNGTIDKTKILNWISLHCAILDYVASGNYDNHKNMSNDLARDIESKTRRMFNMLNIDFSVMRYFQSRQQKFKLENYTAYEKRVESEEIKPVSNTMTTEDIAQRLSSARAMFYTASGIPDISIDLPDLDLVDELTEIE